MRVLIISPHPLTWQDPGSITFASLFSAFRKEEIGQIVIGDPRHEPDLVKTWQVIGPKNVRADQIVRSIMGFRRSKKENSSIVRDVVTTNIGKQLLLSAYADAMPITFTRKDSDWLHEFAPTVIYTTLGSIRCIKTALWVKKLCDVPIVLHYMDDWLDMQYSSLLTHMPRKMLLHLNMKIANNASVHLAISPQMAKQYAMKFGRSFKPFMHCVNVPSVLSKQRNDAGLRLVYAGGLHLYRDDVLCQIGRVIQECNGRIDGVCASIDCYAPESHLCTYRDKLEKAGVCCQRSLNPYEVADVISKYDCLVHAESFNPQAYRYTKLSISTKIPQYLATGIPILAVGPKQQAAIEYLCSNNAAVGVHDLNNDSIKKALSIMTDRKRMNEIRSNAYGLAINNHSIVSESRKFRDIIASAKC